ncbi:hypothetical protein CTI12_AA065710 [Artemisia annua]|uniref:CCHC-type domain-containing protein n=1 Tax=Artemisia annua TaxID=35608 RepID=A0A2U1Q7F7_ARTAN|nr:hypothetical protein CTI12_AA065710 [Artemisia annua]
MDEELSDMMGRVIVNEAEEEVVGYDGEGCKGLENTLLGRVHTDRPYSFQRMKRALSAAWRPRRPISFQELESNMFLVKLDHFVDLKRVLEDGPWSFERNLVVLKSIDNDEQPSELEMTKVPFWVRLFNVPVSRRDKPYVGSIAAKLGEVMEVDNAYFVNRGKHIRARVMINITKPLCRFVTVLNLHNTKVRVHVQYERLPNFCYWCGLLGHTVKECLTKPNEIDEKTFTEWPFQESLRAPNFKDDGPFSGVTFPAYACSSNKHNSNLPRGDNVEESLNQDEVVLRGRIDGQNSGRSISTSHEGNPQSSTTMSVGLERLASFKDVCQDKLHGRFISNNSKPKDNLQGQSKTITDGCDLVVDRTNQCHGSNDVHVKFKNTGQVGANKTVEPELRQDEIGREVISHTGPIDNKQSEAIKATQPKVWKRRHREGHEENIRNETKGETYGGKRSSRECVGEDSMDVDTVKKLKDHCDFNLTASVALQHRRQQ